MQPRTEQLKTESPLVPIYSYAESIKIKLDEGISNIRAVFREAFLLPDSDTDKTVSEQTYEKTWQDIRLYLNSIASARDVMAIDNKFFEFKNQLLNTNEEFRQLSDTRKETWIALIGLIQVLARQRYFLLQLITPDEEFYQCDFKNRTVLMSTILNQKTMQSGSHLSYRLNILIKNIDRQFDTLVNQNHILDNYKAVVNAELETYLTSMRNDAEGFRKSIDGLETDCFAWQDKLSASKHRISDETQTTFAASDRLARKTRLGQIGDRVQTLQAHLGNINEKNVLDFENDLANANGVQADIKALEHDLTEFENVCRVKEEKFEQESRELRTEYEELEKRLSSLRDPEQESAKALAAFRARIAAAAPGTLMPCPKWVNVNEFPVMLQASEVAASLRQLEYSLLKLENDLENASEKTLRVLERLRQSLLLTRMLELKKSRDIEATLLVRRAAAENIFQVFDAQFSDVLAVFSSKESNCKEKWQNAVTAVKSLLSETAGLIRELQAHLDERTEEAEEKAIIHARMHDVNEMKRQARIFQDERIRYSERCTAFDKLSEDLDAEIRKKLAAHLAAQEVELKRQKDKTTADLDALAARINAFKLPQADIPGRISFLNHKRMTSLRQDIADLRASYQQKVSMLKRAQTNREHHERRKELDMIVAETRARVASNAAPKIVEPAPEKPPGFFRRHWKAITATTTSFALGGAALGVGASVLAGGPTLGFSILAMPVMGVLGFIAGAVTGFLAGVVGSAVRDCCGSRKKREAQTLAQKSRPAKTYGTQAAPAYRPGNRLQRLSGFRRESTTGIHHTLGASNSAGAGSLPDPVPQTPQSSLQAPFPGLDTLDSSIPPLRVVYQSSSPR